MSKQLANTTRTEVRTESFVIDVFLDKDDVRMTKILHLGSDADDQWDGLNDERLSSFLNARIGRNGKDRERDSESSPHLVADSNQYGKLKFDPPLRVDRWSSPAGTNGQPHAPAAEPATPTKQTPAAIPAPAACRIVKANFHKRSEDCFPDLTPAPITTADAFDIELVLAPDKAACGHSYWATAFARRHGDGEKVPLGAVRGTLKGPSPSAVISVQPDARREPGVYSIWASIVSESARDTVGVGMLELVAPPPRP